MDMAHSAVQSLDLYRRLVQNGVTDEIKEIVERHFQKDMTPAVEHLKRRQIDVNQSHVAEICRNMVEASKSAFGEPSSADPSLIASTAQLDVQNPYASMGSPASFLANKVLYFDCICTIFQFWSRVRQFDCDKVCSYEIIYLHYFQLADIMVSIFMHI